MRQRAEIDGRHECRARRDHATVRRRVCAPGGGRSVSVAADEGTFPGRGGLPLHYRSWRPPHPRAALVIVHGLAEHSGRYGNVVDYFAPLGYALYAFDLRGHGRSPGPRGYVDSWRDYREDLAAFLARVADREPGLPRFLLGHSMGGVIALDYALVHPEGLQGVIASAPALGRIALPRALWVLAYALNRLRPRFSVRLPLRAGDVTRDARMVRSIEADPLTHDRGTARLAVELRHAAQRVEAHAREWRVPLLIVHGGADRLVSPEGSRRFARRVLFPDRELLEYPGGYHELFNDTIRERVLADVARWMERHLPAASTVRGAEADA